MGGVNTSADYAELMGFGYRDEATKTVVVTDSLLQGGIVAVYYLGTLFGAFLGGYCGDRQGRVKTIALGAIWAVLGACLQCSAQNHDWMICARAVNGIGTGILNAIVPVWATEVADPNHRGAFVAIEFFLNIFGVAVAYWLEFGLSFIDNGTGAFQWRFPIAFQIIPLLLLFGAIWFFPESPRWLCKMDRLEEARYILGRLRGEDNGGEIAQKEFQSIRENVLEEVRESKQNSYWRMFFDFGASGKLHTGRRVQLVIWLQIVQEWVGIAGVTVYAPSKFKTTSPCKTTTVSLTIPSSNLWHCRFRCSKVWVAFWLERHDVHVCNNSLHPHAGQTRSQEYALLGRRWSRYQHVSRGRHVSRRSQRSSCR